ncbi:unnamed protein product [Symbiodinium necroappetens]|uniref:Uncharacterized protein n=1 Tax=Symbiodinium necroappetens TaxID=1628268 RepID=A0A812IPE2_9DINO|nr:unnamed protein product [Symbiodinium necroappetens]
MALRSGFYESRAINEHDGNWVVLRKQSAPLDLVFSAGGLLTKRMLEKLFISRIREEDVQGLARWHDITPEAYAHRCVFQSSPPDTTLDEMESGVRKYLKQAQENKRIQEFNPLRRSGCPGHPSSCAARFYIASEVLPDMDFR